MDRRVFLQRTAGFVVGGGAIGTFLSACGGNVASTTALTAQSGSAQIGLMKAGVLQWGADYVSGSPYVFQDPTNPNQLVGFEWEIAVAMAKLMGVSQQMVETDYGHLDDALAANKFDMVMNGWEITDARKKVELFSDPYYRYGQQIVVRADDPRFARYDLNSVVTLDILRGMTVGTGDGYKAAVYLQADPNLTPKLYEGNLPFDDVKQKKIDASLIDLPLAEYYVAGAGPGATKDPALRLIGKPLYPDVYVCGFNRNNPHAKVLQGKINACIAQLKADGTLKRIYQKWALWNDQQALIGIK
jgi:ABC-type amino acid transport substrate-binding protein